MILCELCCNSRKKLLKLRKMPVAPRSYSLGPSRKTFATEKRPKHVQYTVSFAAELRVRFNIFSGCQFKPMTPSAVLWSGFSFSTAVTCC